MSRPHRILLYCNRLMITLKHLGHHLRVMQACNNSSLLFNVEGRCVVRRRVAEDLTTQSLYYVSSPEHPQFTHQCRSPPPPHRSSRHRHRSIVSLTTGCTTPPPKGRVEPLTHFCQLKVTRAHIRFPMTILKSNISNSPPRCQQFLCSSERV